MPVAQTENWNCFAACLASVLELSIDELPAINPNEYGSTWIEWRRWRDDWLSWLSKLNLAYYDVNFGNETVVRGYTIGTVQSQRLEDSLHSIVCLDGFPVFDPQTANERPYQKEDIDSHAVIAILDPSVLSSRAKAQAKLEEEVES